MSLTESKHYALSAHIRKYTYTRTILSFHDGELIISDTHTQLYIIQYHCYCQVETLQMQVYSCLLCRLYIYIVTHGPCM